MCSCDVGVGKNRHGSLTRPEGQFNGRGLVFLFQADSVSDIAL